MKNLITSVACIMILLVFVIQFTSNQILHNRITAVDQAVNNFKEITRQEGCITDENEELLRQEMQRILNCSSEEIQIDGNRTPVPRGGLISYEVDVPLKQIVAMPGFWGIDEGKNQAGYHLHRSTTSEYLDR